MVKDEKAEELEAKGLYRRAAARWVEVMAQSNSEGDRDWIATHRKECLEKSEGHQPERMITGTCTRP